MSNMKMAKYETMIEDINSKIRRITFARACAGIAIGIVRGMTGIEDDSPGNTALALIYDYEKCNEYAKVIMDKSTLLFLDSYGGSTDVWKEAYPTYDEFKDPKRRIKASKELVQLCRDTESVREGYKFIFWALMILTVEKTDAEEHLALICDFAKMLKITEDDFYDIIQIIKIVYNEVTTVCVFKSDNVSLIFSELLDMYGIEAMIE